MKCTPPPRLIAALLMAVCAVTLSFGQINPPGGGGPGGGGPGGLPAIENVGIDQKDYQGNLTTTDRGIAPESHPSLEYDQSPGHNVMVSHIAYVKGAAATVKLRIYNRRTTPVSGSLTFSGARLATPGPSISDPGPYYLPLSISVSPSTFNLSPNTTMDLTATISGLPSFVAVGSLQVNFSMPVTVEPGTPQEVTGNNGTEGYWNTWERICVLDAAPIGLQAVPWTDVLEYSCRWAYGASGSASVREEMTKGIHYGKRSPFNRLQYNPDHPHYWTTESVVYALGNFLADVGDPQQYSGPTIWTQLDCQDFAGLLHLAISSQGHQTACREIGAAQPTLFTTWPLCRAGDDSTITGPKSSDGYRSGNYGSEVFGFHVIVHQGSWAYDCSSSYRYSSNGSSWVNPVWAWNTTDHWQRGSHPYFGLAFRTTGSADEEKLLNSFNFDDLPTGTNSIQIELGYENDIAPTMIL